MRPLGWGGANLAPGSVVHNSIPEVLMPTVPAPRPTGSPAAWGRDLALIGAVTSFVLPSLMGPVVPSGFAARAGVAGAVGGLLLGLAMPAVLDMLRGRVAIRWLLLLAPMVGAAWGGAAGAVAGLASDRSAALLGLISGGIAGACQLGLWWFPYTFQTVRGGRRWPLVLAAVLSSPVLIVPVYVGTLLVMGLVERLS